MQPTSDDQPSPFLADIFLRVYNLSVLEIRLPGQSLDMLLSSILLSLAFGRVHANAGDDDDLMSFVTVRSSGWSLALFADFSASKRAGIEF